MTSIVRMLGVAAVAALFAGGIAVCQPAQAGVLVAHPVHVVSTFGNPTCRHHGGARVNPCTLDFTATSPGPFMVTTFNEQGKKASFSEQDNCTGIATVVSEGSNQWLVSAGPYAGSCTATFTITNAKGKVVGTAELNITNSL